MAETTTVRIRVRRQDARDKTESRRWEEFDVPRSPRMTVHGALAHIRRKPITASGERVSPPVWEASCLDESCGACTMNIDGRARLACATFVDDVSPNGRPVRVEPLEKFPVVRDLVVDRGRIFDHVRQLRAWVDADSLGASPVGAAPIEGRRDQAERHALGRCIGCGACFEACPEYREERPFVGPASIHKVRLTLLAPAPALDRAARVEALMGPGGVQDCGKAQNCVEVCPKELPLVDSIARMSRETTKRFLFGWILGG